ncbi:MAG: response regulator [Acholeplasmataceae bacterium]|nr:response regulator [Acholeplasmataceae bacterium]
MDCNYVQGYYYARPMPEKDFEALIKKAVIDREMVRPARIIPTYDVKVSKNPKHEEIMLIVDDVKLNRVILANIFKQNYTIVEADNGAAALHYLFENADKIAIVMLDLIMPIMDGFEVLSKMKLSPELNLIPIIVTSQTGEEMEIKALKMGADDFVAKPYVKELCHKRVENVLAAVRKN